MTTAPLQDPPLDGESVSSPGEIWRVAGPVVVARGLDGVRLYNVVRVGEAALPGEVIRLDGEDATIQVYEDTAGLRVGEPVRDTGRPLEVELGPGLLGRIFDGTQRPLEVLARAGEDPVGRPLLPRGVDVPALDRERRWTFEPSVVEGATVAPGDVLGVVAETAALEHRVLVPLHRAGVVTAVRPGPARLEDPVAWIDRSAGHDAEPLAGARSTTVPRSARPVDAADHRPAGDRRPVPDRPRRSRHHPGRVRHRARPCSSSRWRNGRTPTSSSTSPAASAATSSRRCSRSSPRSSIRAPERR